MWFSLIRFLFVRKVTFNITYLKRATCADNAAMENFFGNLKQEMDDGEELLSYGGLKKKIAEYIEYYNNIRFKQKLNGLSPVQYRTQTSQSAA
ncbi:IS3 family transposase [Bacillus massiliglaciei]|uniref:IS3 family transposase n=1 Tax=Bacillus massiliglaciei TaxID=1816693 RepID=UPI003898EEA5